MDYVVGSIAALISGNVTPSRPKQLKKAHTPIKHQPSPNVTPKSEFLDDRSIFLSPTMQKKKAIVKKSPKRIFENPDLDITNNEEDCAVKSPKADKVKKHLKEELEAGSKVNLILAKSKSTELDSNEVELSPKKKSKKKRHNLDNNDSSVKNVEIQNAEAEELVPADEILNNAEEENISNTVIVHKSNKKRKKRSKSLIGIETVEVSTNAPEETENTKKVSKKRKNNELPQSEMAVEVNNAVVTDNQSPKKKNKKKKNSKQNKDNTKVTVNEDVVNLNAVTNKDTDSEHDSDNEIGSENEEIYNKAINTGTVEEDDKSSDEEAPEETKIKKNDPTKGHQKYTEDEIVRTIFVGNVPFSSKCKKEIKKIFDQYGQIETVRIRTVPVKDARDTPKLAVIKNEIHPDRTAVNVYVKFTHAESVEKALAANNTLLHDNHLRVTRSDTTGATHDPKCSVFVGNMPFALEDDALRATFAKCGKIDSVRIIRDKKTNAGKGFGYINFASKDGVELALALTEEDLTIKNRILRVKRCTQTTPNKFGKKDKFKNQGYQGNKQMGNFGRGNFGGRQNNERNEGAYRRVMNKRKNQESGDGPPNKRQNSYQPNKDKKERKEFVGMTAEKKKKSKFDKGHKKKKALSEILTKK